MGQQGIGSENSREEAPSNVIPDDSKSLPFLSRLVGANHRPAREAITEWRSRNLTIDTSPHFDITGLPGRTIAY
jgi:hypothetical protein